MWMDSNVCLDDKFDGEMLKNCWGDIKGMGEGRCTCEHHIRIPFTTRSIQMQMILCAVKWVYQNLNVIS